MEKIRTVKCKSDFTRETAAGVVRHTIPEGVTFMLRPKKQ